MMQQPEKDAGKGIRSALKKFVRFSVPDDKAVFWLFWIFFVLSIPFQLAERHGRDPTDLSTPLRWGIIIGPILLGIAVWKLLQWKRISPVKDFVIGLQGLMAFPFAAFVIWFLLLMVISLAFNGDIEAFPSFFAIIMAVLLLVPGLILGGCWLGFKIRNPVALIILWCVIIAGFFIRHGLPGLYVSVVLVPALVGTYIGRTRLARTKELGSGLEM